VKAIISKLKIDMTSQPQTFEGRLRALSDGRPGIRAAMRVDIRDVSPRDPQPGGSAPADTAAPILEFVASDETLDRYGEMIRATGWRLENYRRNPVFQNAHQYGDIIFTLGRALSTEIRSLPSTVNNQLSTCLYQRVEFATAVNPMARIAYGLYRGKFLNAVSVGFIPLRWQDPNGVDHQAGRGVRAAPPGPGVVAPEPAAARELAAPEQGGGGLVAPKRSGGGRPPRIYLEQELLEVSAVAIPANPGALALAVKSGAVEKSDLKDTLDLLRQVTFAAPAQSAGRASETRSLLSLARTLRNLLRRTG
jgi:hypothetical protein